MNRQEINNIREELLSFFKSNEKLFTFEVNCDLNFRIKFIYSVLFPGLKKLRFYLRFFLSRIAFYCDYSPLKVLLYKAIGIKIGKGVFISPRVDIDVHFPELIVIGDYAILGYGASIFAHDFTNKRYRLGRINIGKGSVIGAFSIIGCGVTIAEKSDVRVRSVVLKDIS